MTTKIWLPVMALATIFAGGLLFSAACSDSDDDGDRLPPDSGVRVSDRGVVGSDATTMADAGIDNTQGTCTRNDGNGKFCIAYYGIPASNLTAVKGGCAESWGGSWAAGELECPGTGLIGTCTLTGSAKGGAVGAIMKVFTPTDPDTARNSICGDDGTWEPAAG
ncbi:MAG: hypothetical protein IPL40_13370 [Proteobacteria bacterium]|nr:hypothetical protein [Pseudomonadota bacterium]